MKNFCAIIFLLFVTIGCCKEEVTEYKEVEIGSPCTTLGENACHPGGLAVLRCVEDADTSQLTFQVDMPCDQDSQYCDQVFFEDDSDATYVCNCDQAICENGGCPLGYPGPYCSPFYGNKSMCLCHECDDDFCDQECREQGEAGGECTPDIDHVCECFS